MSALEEMNTYEMEKRENYCNNCGNYGHIFNQCKKPITSIGIICLRENNNKYEFLCVQRKDSMGYVDILRGKYNLCNNFQLGNILTEITKKEYDKLKKYDFKRLWIDLWNINDKKELIQLETNTKTNNEIKLCKLKQTEIFKKFSPKYTEPEWGFPKGRRNFKEIDIDCALREFEEETGISKEKIKLINNIYSLEEIFTGSNLKSYKHKYYLAYINYEDSLDLSNYQQSEIGNIKWFTLEECLKRFRDYNYEKIDLIKNVNIILQKFNLVFN
tara:strand:- start:841 stop:1656 length:816 start_codon:yes stop_codon:yes gene_type:complete